MTNKIKDELKKILGDDAYNDGSMQVSDRVQKLAKAVNYLVIQLKFTARLQEDFEREAHIEQVINNVKEIIS